MSKIKSLNKDIFYTIEDDGKDDGVIVKKISFESLLFIDKINEIIDVLNSLQQEKGAKE